MARYVDSFLVPVRRQNFKAYQQIARLSAKAWIKYGALEYIETVVHRTVKKGGKSPLLSDITLSHDEVMVFGVVIYKSRTHRDRVVKKITQDKKLLKMWDELPFDSMRMILDRFHEI